MSVKEFIEKFSEQVELLVDEVNDDKRAEVYKAIAKMKKPSCYRDSLRAAIGSLTRMGLSRGVLPSISEFIAEDVIYNFGIYERKALSKGSNYELLNACYVLAREIEWDLSDGSNLTYIENILKD